jgi:hypothetical protein
VTHTLSEAREAVKRQMWGKKAPEWAVEMVRQADATPAEAREAIATAKTFGRAAPGWAVAVVEEAESSRAWLTAAGFCAEDVDRGVKLLESGRYFSLADLAHSMLNDPVVSTRNRAVTRERIASVAEVQSRGGH